MPLPALHRRHLFVLAGAIFALAAAPACAEPVDRVAQQDQQRMHRADIRASVADFVRIEAGDGLHRSSLSDEERLQMRRQIDEAIRKAYGRRLREAD